MTSDAILDKIFAVTRAATSGGLLDDVDALTAGIEADGWTRAVGGGHWHDANAPGWSLLSGDHAPNLAVFYFDDDAAPVFAAGRELARKFDHDEQLIRHGDHPDWPSWPTGDPRWSAWTGLQSNWPTWVGGDAHVSLNVRAAHQPGRIRTPPHLHLQIERIDTPAEGLPEEAARAHRVARTGSPAARWHLAGEHGLPADVADLLRLDEDPAVIAAIEARETVGRKRRR